MIVFLNAPFYGDKWHGIRAGCRWPFISDGTIDATKLKEREDCYYQTYPFFLGFATNYFIKSGKEAVLYDALALNHSYDSFYARMRTWAGADAKVFMETAYISFEQDCLIALNLKDMGFKVCMVGSGVFEKEVPAGIEKIEGNYLEKLILAEHPDCKSYIDELPAMPYRDKEIAHLYNDYFSFGQFVQKPQMQVWTSIGCPYSCSFCLWRWTITGGKFARRRIHHVEQEIKHGIETFGYKHILFDDDTFNVGDKYPLQIAKMMRTKFKGVQWSAMVRADSCSVKTFKEMYDSGCMGLKVGVETFSDGVLKKIGKGLDSVGLLGRIIQLVDIGFYVYLSTMQHIAGESDTEREQTEIYLKELHKMGVRYQRPHCIPLVGTPMYKQFRMWEKSKFSTEVPVWDFADYYKATELKKRIEQFTRENG